MSVNAKQSISGSVISGGNVRGSVGSGRVDVYSYYTPEVTQPDENTMRVEYVPSERNMPNIEPVVVTLPKGVDGKDGKDGEDGYTPQKGIDYFDGKDGIDGKDGYTPQKGVDYFTSDDISQVANTAADLIRDDIAAGIASAIGGSY
jgi:hypothetical protein